MFIGFLLVAGQVTLEGKPEGNLGARVTKGNVYLDGKPICDKGWNFEDATVVCRWINYHFWYLYIISSLPGCLDTAKGSRSWALDMVQLVSMRSSSTQRYPVRGTRKICWIVPLSKFCPSITHIISHVAPIIIIGHDVYQCVHQEKIVARRA